MSVCLCVCVSVCLCAPARAVYQDWKKKMANLDEDAACDDGDSVGEAL